ncbi:chorismate mutase [Salsuginibacillus halophilus]|uniref:chorismate mutase n=1 Tax=Salsuginibacillus halophilus TaxID=517424 RepID=A0A2P8HW91_9BACI|nr:chorismate mutase [Salsuginibacillus halophilus]PSL50497.1 chorismate mutase [Salsuginibacillus halophilus]
MRGIRGATTAETNESSAILTAAEEVLRDMAEKNNIKAEDVVHIWFTVTTDLTAAFPAKATRSLEGWSYVPVMCATEIPVPNSLPRCIRVMMTVNDDRPQEDICHVYHKDAVQLRPDLIN